MRSAWRWVRVLGGILLLAALALRVGGDAFVAGLRRVDAPALAAGVALNALATVAAARRWQLVARALGAPLAMPAAVAACYRAQFLNTTLPGGVVGDVHRGVRHGRDVADLGRGLRAVAWERGIGQAVQVLAVLTVLAAVPSPLRAALPYLLAGLGLAAVAAVAVARTRWSATLRGDARALLCSGRLGSAAGWSLLCVVAHATTFVVAARTAGAPATIEQLLPLAALLLVAMAVPLNVGGWGPREGVAAWAFAITGMTAAQGVAAATVYGVLVLVASLPGAAVLLRPRRRDDLPAGRTPARTAVTVGSARG